MMDSNALKTSPRFTNGDSILAPGGSVSNMYALMIARHKLYPQVNLIFWLFLRCGDDAAGGEGINATFDANFGELSFVFSSAQEVWDAGHQRTTDHVHQSAREWHHHLCRGHHHRGHPHHQDRDHRDHQQDRHQCYSSAPLLDQRGRLGDRSRDRQLRSSHVRRKVSYCYHYYHCQLYHLFLLSL